MQIPSQANVNANIKVEPIRSQVFLIGILLLSALFALIGSFLIYQEKYSGWAFIILCMVLVYKAFSAWTESQSDNDLDSSIATTVTNPDGASMTTDSRMFTTPERLKLLLEFTNKFFYMKPLPEADGVVDSNLNLVPNSADQAKQVTADINTKVQESANNFMTALGVAELPPATLQDIPTELPNTGLSEPQQSLNIPSGEAPIPDIDRERT